MSIIVTTLVIAALAPGDGSSANQVLERLLNKGVPVSDGAFVKLPAPAMPDALDAAGQHALIAKLAEGKHSVEELMRKSIVSPLMLNIQPIKSPGGRSPLRQVDVWFIAYGDWERVSSKDFLESLLGFAGGSATGASTSSSGFLSPAALAKRAIQLESRPDQQEGRYFTRISLFDRVELSATRQVLITRRPDSLLIAAAIDPCFNGDPEYPNQWRSMSRDLDNPHRVVYGQPQVYTSAGFYGKITRLAEPAGAMFVEYHVVFEEPEGWFSGANLLGSKLPLVIQDEVRKFRRRVLGPPSSK